MIKVSRTNRRDAHIDEDKYPSATNWTVKESSNLVIWNGDNQVAEYLYNEWFKVEKVEE